MTPLFCIKASVAIEKPNVDTITGPLIVTYYFSLEALIFIQQVCVEHILCARRWSRHFEHMIEQKYKIPTLMELKFREGGIVTDDKQQM